MSLWPVRLPPSGAGRSRVPAFVSLTCVGMGFGWKLPLRDPGFYKSPLTHMPMSNPNTFIKSPTHSLSLQTGLWWHGYFSRSSVPFPWCLFVSPGRVSVEVHGRPWVALRGNWEIWSVLSPFHFPHVRWSAFFSPDMKNISPKAQSNRHKHSQTETSTRGGAKINFTL